MSDKKQVSPKVTASYEGPEDDAPSYEQRFLPSREVPIPHATVIPSLGLTINLGNYESARVGVGVEFPCDPNKIDEAFDEAWKVCKDQLREQAKGMRGKAAKLASQGF